MYVCSYTRYGNQLTNPSHPETTVAIVTVVVTESAREKDHADVRAHPDTARAEKNSRETHTRRAATTESAKEKTDTLEEIDVEVVAIGTEETVAQSDVETAVTTHAQVAPESVTTVGVICSTIAEVVVEEVATAMLDVPLNNPSTRSAVPALRESPRSPPPI
jgi:glycerol-3-phosphate cytidylyltransferase-like family protein